MWGESRPFKSAGVTTLITSPAMMPVTIIKAACLKSFLSI
jgi:hypothetical protein